MLRNRQTVYYNIDNVQSHCTNGVTNVAKDHRVMLVCIWHCDEGLRTTLNSFILIRMLCSFVGMVNCTFHRCINMVPFITECVNNTYCAMVMGRNICHETTHCCVGKYYWSVWGVMKSAYWSHLEKISSIPEIPVNENTIDFWKEINEKV